MMVKQQANLGPSDLMKAPGRVGRARASDRVLPPSNWTGSQGYKADPLKPGEADVVALKWAKLQGCRTKGAQLGITCEILPRSNHETLISHHIATRHSAPLSLTRTPSMSLRFAWDR
jgi:hypothetical protein